MTLPNEIWSALLGALLGAWITYRFALVLARKGFEQLCEVSRIDAWRASGREFVRALSPELSTLKTGAELRGDVMDFLREASERHAEAATVFEHHLSGKDREAFSRDWLRFRYGSKDNGDPESPEGEESLRHDELLYLHFSNEWPASGLPSARNRAIAGIERLLSYARDD